MKKIDNESTIPSCFSFREAKNGNNQPSSENYNQSYGSCFQIKNKKRVFFNFSIYLALAILSLLFTFNSCKSLKKNGSTIQPVTVIEKAIVDSSFSNKAKNMPVQIQDIKLVSPGIIEIVFNYSGGCEEHDFKLYAVPGMVKTLPPKINFYLVDKQEKDFCRQLITASKQFDISAALPKDYKKITLLVNHQFEYLIDNHANQGFK